MGSCPKMRRKIRETRRFFLENRSISIGFLDFTTKNMGFSYKILDGFFSLLGG